MGRGRGGRNRKPRNSATFRLCPRPGTADPTDRVLVRVDGNPYYVPGLDDGDDDGCFFDASAAAAGEDDAKPSSSPSALPDHVRAAILELGLPDDGYNYLTHIREIRPSYSSTGGGGSSAVFLPSRRTARCGLPLSVKAYDARSIGVDLDNVAAPGAVMPIEEEAIDPDVTRLLEEESEVPQETPDDDDDDEDEDENDDDDEDENEGSELEEDFVIIANQPEEEDDMDLEDDFVILANQSDGEEQMSMLDRLKRGVFTAALWAC